MEYKTIAGNYYTITSKSGCSVTDATGTLSMTVDAGGQLTVQAPSDKLVYDDEQAIVFKANFKHALAVAGLLGGGDKLPAGYTRLEFLESTGAQWFDSGIVPTASTGLLLDNQLTSQDDTIPFGCRNSSTTDTRFYACRAPRTTTNGTYMGYGWGAWVALGPTEPGVRALTKMNWLQAGTVEGLGLKRDLAALPFTPTRTLYLFAANVGGAAQLQFKGRTWRAAVSQGHQIAQDFRPALDPTGVPCMYDLVSKRAYKNAGSGSFVAGMTLAQAAQLGRKLPSTGGSLTVSLPEGYDSNEAVVNSLTKAESKGWVLTIQTYAAQAAAATFALRRVWVRRQQAEYGSYVASDGTRWLVEWCVDVIGADPESLGYERLRSVEVAVDYWGLTPYVDPNAEPETEPETEPEELSTIE